MNCSTEADIPSVDWDENSEVKMQASPGMKIHLSQSAE